MNTLTIYEHDGTANLNAGSTVIVAFSRPGYFIPGNGLESVGTRASRLTVPIPEDGLSEDVLCDDPRFGV